MGYKGREDIEKQFPGFKNHLYLYISGCQGVPNMDMTIEFGVDFNYLEDVAPIFNEFIEETIWENIDDYLDDCDGDEQEAFMEALVDCGPFYIGIDEQTLTHQFDGGIFIQMEELD